MILSGEAVMIVARKGAYCDLLRGFFCQPYDRGQGSISEEAKYDVLALLVDNTYRTIGV